MLRSETGEMPTRGGLVSHDHWCFASFFHANGQAFAQPVVPPFSCETWAAACNPPVIARVRTGLSYG